MNHFLFIVKTKVYEMKPVSPISVENNINYTLTITHMTFYFILKNNFSNLKYIL